MTEPAREPPATGATVPSMPRIYNHLQGGKDAYAADRALADDLMARHPGLAQLARINRRFVLAASEWVAAGGVRQFLDLGCGFPLPPALHEAVRDAEPSATVIYVDRDPLVACHSAALQAGPGLATIKADVRDPGRVLGLVLDTGLIDPREPACVILGATLSAMPAGVAARTVAGYMGALAPGSYAVISCASYDDPVLGAQMEAVAGRAGEWHNHSAADVARFFGGLHLESGQVRDVRPWCWPQFQEEVDGAAVIGGIGLRP